MRRLISLLIVGLLLCSCSGIGQQKLLTIDNLNFSFSPPPSNWHKIALLPRHIKNHDYTVSWRKSGGSLIMVSANKITENSKQKSYKDILYSQVDGRRQRLEKQCGEVSRTIGNESKGLFQEGVKYEKIEATITCSKSGRLIKTIRIETYILYTEEYRYRFGFDSKSTKFEQDRNEFQQVLNSFSYIK